ncbi:hypothetical protein HU147_12480 [Planomicrobium chinense]|uniref:sugar-transfer associated ATP-grasp domain-containing protein n=1 Tax=Planococcus chinensis TaxID=272917 RepID=UPI001CC63CBF|nr:sugar-transfer associated ATP-grasp domain-containing protein [Planococcus chinensis]MBZ5202036.1 hypothetical protein [Planococcus chinensis]
MNILSYLQTIIEDENRKSIFKIVKEAIHCALIEKEIPIYYFTSLLYKKKSNNYRKYIGHKKIWKIYNEFFYKRGSSKELEDKISFSKVLISNNIMTPQMLAYNKGNRMILMNEEVELKNEKQLLEIIRILFRQSNSSSIFIKPTNGVGGSHSYIIDEKMIEDSKEILNLFYLLNQFDFIFQETIVQHPIINEVYSKSINTIRVHTYYNRDEKHTEITSALMRFGYGGAIVDNGSSGGMFVSIDTDRWELVGSGSSYLKSGGLAFQSHPDSNEKFHGLVLPYGTAIEETVKNAATLFSYDFIGWDIALTETGPVIIEGNENPHLIMMQMACGGFVDHPKYSKIFSDFI